MPSKPSWEASERETFRVTFDEDALAYDRVRPVAPGFVFDDLVELAGLHPGFRRSVSGGPDGKRVRPALVLACQVIGRSAAGVRSAMLP